jgi:hypothetical protein
LGTIKILDELGEEWFERVELKDKLILVPYVLFGQSFSKGEQPYQDMALLIRVRNEIAHYKMKQASPRCFTDLDQRGISLGEKNTWPKRLSSVQGIRWAHNTVCRTVRQLVSFIPVELYRQSLEKITLPSFEVIP